ncbi:hypothetical protein HPP92_010600 [Vanilla planifolia]|uniref:Uncharacterized protein n=1 Tax=Vanilla planifolia TaxID=51239 RepID=A0A835V483_VANPL|nr:hypothetical protein HPP92_010600 [Vanilla planifolia]
MPFASSALFGCNYGLYSARCSYCFPNYRLSSTIHRRLRIARTLANDTAALQDGGFIETVCSSSNADADSTVIRTLSLQQKERISLFVGSLLEWNERMNLTAVKQRSDVMKRHVEDSLALLPPLRRSYLSWCCPASSPSSCDGLRLVDVGSGSGLPGLMLAIACPSWKVTLLDSMHKRCLFLEHVVALIGLSNVEVLCERAEEEIRNAERAVQLMGGSILELCSVESHSPLGQRTAVICFKGKATPKKYPRNTGIPSKMPL